jgi:hypothetical protein
MIVEFESNSGRHAIVISEICGFTVRTIRDKEEIIISSELHIVFRGTFEFYTFENRGEALTVYDKIKAAFEDINMETIISRKIEERLSSIK